MGFTRRQLLSAAAATAGTSVLAGCIGGATDDGATTTDETTTASTFFVFGDVTERVAGDAAAADLLVPLGQHGHGWEPGPSVRAAVRDADVLVHGMSGFQPWADDILVDLDADGAAVATVDVSSGLDLLDAAGGHDDHDRHDDDAHDDHTTTDQQTTAQQTTEHTTTEQTTTEHTDGHDEDGHDGDGQDGDGHDDGHDHGEGSDPHFWMDPLRLRDATGNVEEALAAVDPENADAYAANADAFRSDLDALHDRIESVVADANKSVLLVAGHDSYQYFGDRYGVDVVALTDVSPDDRPTAKDVERAQDAVREHDLAYICADPLESQQAAEQLVAETDAEAVLPLTAMPGLTDEWATEDWGYVDVMEHVNLPTLSRALDAA